MRFVRRKRSKYADISMLNLIDVIFMLLLFFMLTTTFNKLAQFDIKLPQVSAKQTSEDRADVEIYYGLDGKVLLKVGDNDINLNIDNVEKVVSNLSEQHKENLRLNADERLEYGEVMKLISKLKEANVKNVELNIQKK